MAKGPDRGPNPLSPRRSPRGTSSRSPGKRSAHSGSAPDRGRKVNTSGTGGSWGGGGSSSCMVLVVGVLIVVAVLGEAARWLA